MALYPAELRDLGNCPLSTSIVLADRKRRFAKAPEDMIDVARERDTTMTKKIIVS
ncbi:MAG: hypothetical protein OXF88_19630 [Rhodobacteraceae bacterium]|nr:hypothetical protein [Paracoccaceae bacterium]MCY4140146.1 hypothetical protein [Paracoccaceae bacterium]